VSDRLSSYRAKRKPGSTPEPALTSEHALTSGLTGAPSRSRAPGSEADEFRFVVQEHSARHMHWDLRLEHDGVLASWALPRGVPDDPAQNRKAVRTEDHPLAYLEFEGEIPPGSYGAGTMSIWDRGTFRLEKWREDEVIAVFDGERLRGRYALFRAGEQRDWLLHRMDPPSAEAAGREPLPHDIAPMLARPGVLPADESRYALEIKWDGVRAIAYATPGELQLQSRNLRDITRSYPELRALSRALGSRTAVLDGEIVAFDQDGRPSFSRLQERMHVDSDSAARSRATRTPVVYMIFDLLYLDGRSLLACSYRERRESLVALGLNGPSWQSPAAHEGDAAELLEATARQGLEGLLVKRLDSIYESGKRTGAWLKVKNKRRQELVIGGWLPGEGRRAQTIGALLLGYYDPDGRLVYAGRVGSGFSEGTLTQLRARVATLARASAPFPQARLPRGAQFVEPRLVAEIEFTEWTPDGQLRHPIYKGLRDDRDARDVGREDPIVLEARGAAAAGSPSSPRAPESDDGPQIFDEARPTRSGYDVVIDARQLRLSNYRKVLFAATGFSKGDLIEYYARVAPVMLPHLRDRPMTLKRYPDGVDGEFFYEKNCPSHRPDWIQTASLGAGRGSKPTRYCLVQDLPTLVWAANLAAIEMHTGLAHVSAIVRPTVVVFDLDPGAPAGMLECCEVALVLEGMFAALGLQVFVKTSGSKGLQVYLPLNSEVEFPATKAFARQVAELLAAQAPELVVSRMTKSTRTGRVLVDWSQNDEHKTTVSVYSVRAQPRPTVSAPVSWQEVSQAHDSGQTDGLVLGPEQVLTRVASDGDLFAPLLSLRQQLPEL
jgi:bifunctional non-homologous end joining protein LigD